jgi:hypothetical protein
MSLATHPLARTRSPCISLVRLRSRGDFTDDEDAISEAQHEPLAAAAQEAVEQQLTWAGLASLPQHQQYKLLADKLYELAARTECSADLEGLVEILLEKNNHAKLLQMIASTEHGLGTHNLAEALQGAALTRHARQMAEAIEDAEATCAAEWADYFEAAAKKVEVEEVPAEELGLHNLFFEDEEAGKEHGGDSDTKRDYDDGVDWHGFSDVSEPEPELEPEPEPEPELETDPEGVPPSIGGAHEIEAEGGLGDWVCTIPTPELTRLVGMPQAELVALFSAALIDRQCKAQPTEGTFEVFNDPPADHHYLSTPSPNGSSCKKMLKRVTQEWGQLQLGLPVGVHVQVSEGRMDLMRAVVEGPAGTPYQGGLYVLDICLPQQYPDEPPKAHYW